MDTKRKFQKYAGRQISCQGSILLYTTMVFAASIHCQREHQISQPAYVVPPAMSAPPSELHRSLPTSVAKKNI